MEPNHKEFIPVQLADSDEAVQRIYEGMNLDEMHVWTKYTEYEVQFIVDNLNLKCGDSVLDIGCGQGRHSLALGNRGMVVTGIDFVKNWIERAKVAAKSKALRKIKFVKCDARKQMKMGEFDSVLCLYDVIGSFANDLDNLGIIRNVYAHLKPGRSALISVMNAELTERKAQRRFRLSENPEALFDLPPSKTMQSTGEVFDPEFYLLDVDTKLVYRKEQFDREGGHLPAELIVRDRRYFANEIAEICRQQGFQVEWVRHVRVGKWDLDITDPASEAKEVLLKLRKPDSSH